MGDFVNGLLINLLVRSGGLQVVLRRLLLAQLIQPVREVRMQLVDALHLFLLTGKLVIQDANQLILLRQFLLYLFNISIGLLVLLLLHLCILVEFLHRVE